MMTKFSIGVGRNRIMGFDEFVVSQPKHYRPNIKKLINVVREMNGNERCWEYHVGGVDYKIEVLAYSFIVRRIIDTTNQKVYDWGDVTIKHWKEIRDFIDYKFEDIIQEVLDSEDVRFLTQDEMEEYIRLSDMKYLPPYESYHFRFFEKCVMDGFYKEDIPVIKKENNSFLNLKGVVWIIQKLQKIWNFMKN